MAKLHPMPVCIVASLLALSTLGNRLPPHKGLQVPQDTLDTLEAADGVVQGWPCLSSYCKKPKKKYEASQPAFAPRIQWNDAGGYCGSMAIQNVAMGKGIWLSQQQVRDHASPGGGHDNEILATNVDQTLTNLKLTWEQFQYKQLPIPQANAYRTWLKKMLVEGNSVFWMIMLQNGHYPVYPSLPYGFYSHVEPVFGVMSDHPLDDPQWYDDDYIVHGTDASTQTYYRRFDSLVADVNADNSSLCRGAYLGYPCIYKNYGFGFAIKGPLDNQTSSNVVNIALSVGRTDEPDTRAGRKAVPLMGSLLATELTVGTTYEIWRWNSTDTAYDYAMKEAVVHHFTATQSNYSWNDPTSFLSSSATYWRCVVSKNK
jgi:hypothetical protein